jgi:hypothetical protein
MTGASGEPAVERDASHPVDGIKHFQHGTGGGLTSATLCDYAGKTDDLKAVFLVTADTPHETRR